MTVEPLLLTADARAHPRGGRAKGGVSGSGHELDACIDTALLGFIQEIQQHAKGNMVGGLSDASPSLPMVQRH